MHIQMCYAIFYALIMHVCIFGRPLLFLHKNVDIKLSDKLPEGIRTMAQLLIKQLQSGDLDPFDRQILTQDGTLINTPLTADELLRMDYLCHNVEGSIPGFDALLPMAKPMVRELGIYRDGIPAEKEVAL